MAFIDTRGIKQSSAFNLRTALPLDLRTVRQDIVDRDDIPIQYRYEGMECYVSNNQTLYRLKGGVQNVHWVPECCIKYNLEAQTNPTNINNENEGYTVGSIWYDEVAGNTYLLSKFGANGDAVWVQIGGDFNWTEILW